ncbi:unnamed protein product, partial [Urochloa humidicola]
RAAPLPAEALRKNALHLADNVKNDKVSLRSIAMATAQPSEAEADKGLPLGMDKTMVEEYMPPSQSFCKNLLRSPVVTRLGSSILSIVLQKLHPKRWFPLGQSDLLGNKRRKLLLNSHISKSASKSVYFH